jgi:multidrug resistance efflux pump
VRYLTVPFLHYADARFAAIETEIRVAARLLQEEIDRRMNEQSRVMNAEVAHGDAVHDALRARVAALELSRSELAGAVSQRRLSTGQMLAVISVLIAAVSVAVTIILAARP